VPDLVPEGLAFVALVPTLAGAISGVGPEVPGVGPEVPGVEPEVSRAAPAISGVRAEAPGVAPPMAAVAPAIPRVAPPMAAVAREASAFAAAVPKRAVSGAALVVRGPSAARRPDSTSGLIEGPLPLIVYPGRACLTPARREDHPTMTSKAPNPPPDAIFSIDLNPLKAALVDLPPRATIGMRHEQEGIDAVIAEIVSNQKTYGDRAGITATNFNRFTTLNGQFDQLEAKLPAVSKAVEVLTESLVYVDNRRHQLATQFANSAESSARATGTPTLLTAYEKTIKYRGIIAAKAVKTRKDNEENKPADSPPPAPPVTGGEGERATKAREPVTRVPNPPPDNIFAIDLTPRKPFLVDLPPGAMRGMRQEQEGWVDVHAEIVTNQPTYGDAAGITATDFAKFTALHTQHGQIAAALPVVEKAHEVLEESQAYVDDSRHKLITQFADAALAHARGEGGDPTLLTAYEKTIAFVFNAGLLPGPAFGLSAAVGLQWHHWGMGVEGRALIAPSFSTQCVQADPNVPFQGASSKWIANQSGHCAPSGGKPTGKVTPDSATAQAFCCWE
jgi:hypothetical protein